MDAVKYIKERNRHINRTEKFCGINCIDCILSAANNGRGVNCQTFETRYTDEAVRLVEDWSRNHPQKTYNQDFFEKFPDARKDEFGDPLVCRKRIYKSECICGLSCHTCWNEAIEGGD